jgi:ribosome-interacting GTPase 1
MLTSLTADDLIDIIEGNRAYIPYIYLLNKIGTTFYSYNIL